MAIHSIHKELQDSNIPLEYFVVWNETLGWERGLPQFRERPTFTEEGVLELMNGEFMYTPVRRLLAPHMPTSSPALATEVGDNSSHPSPMALAPPQNGLGASASPVMHEYPSADADAGSSCVVIQFNHHHQSFSQSPNYSLFHGVPESVMEEIDEQPFFLPFPSVDNNAPHTQWPLSNSLNRYSQEDVQMMDYPGYIP